MSSLYQVWHRSPTPEDKGRQQGRRGKLQGQKGIGELIPCSCRFSGEPQEVVSSLYQVWRRSPTPGRQGVATGEEGGVAGTEGDRQTNTLLQLVL